MPHVPRACGKDLQAPLYVDRCCVCVCVCEVSYVSVCVRVHRVCIAFHCCLFSRYSGYAHEGIIYCRTLELSWS